MADKTLEVESKQKLEINESEAILAEYNKTRDVNYIKSKRRQFNINS
jgi:hypothetical protein